MKIKTSLERWIAIVFALVLAVCSFFTLYYNIFMVNTPYSQ